MSSEHSFEDKGKVKPKRTHEAAEPEKEGGSLTAADMEGKLDASTLTQMQQTLGNAAVQRLLAQRQGQGPAEIQEETANTINAKRGSGSNLDPQVAKKAGAAMGQDFSDVNVHTDGQADELSRQLGAKAFTTGSDIFFQSGAYDPGSSDGQRLIAHELTHVQQQSGRAPASPEKMTVNDPDDQYEEEADSVADQVMNQPDLDLQRQPIEEEEEMMMPKLDPALQRQEQNEEDVMAKLDPALQRQDIPEEEEAMAKLDPALQRQEQNEEDVMAKPDLYRQTAEEEEEEEMVMPNLDPALQRQELPEEEEAMAKPDLSRQPIEEEEEMMMPKLDPSLQRQEELEEEV